MILLLVISTSSNASEEDAAQQAVRSETMESYTKDEGKGKQGEQGGGGGAGDASGHGAEQVSAERVPLGRCMPPIPPAPNPRRGEMLMNNKQQQSKQGTGRAGRRQSHILVVSDTREGHPTKPMPKWKRGYIGFKRKVKSSAFVPSLLLVASCGMAVHVVGLAGASLGYFTWSVGCEGVVTVGEDSGRANGEQNYRIGWIQYEGEGPSISSDIATITRNSTDNGTIRADPGQGGVAGSTVPEQDWLAGVDATSATLGVLVAIGHLLGIVYYMVTLVTAKKLFFGTHFRSNRPLFWPAAKASGALLAWLVAFGGIGFNLAAQESFKEQIISILHDDGFLCEANSSVTGDFAYIATGFGCVACALTFFLTWRLGQTADNALIDRFQRKASLVHVHTAISPS